MIRLILMIFALAVSSACFATGGGFGNGGQSIVCRDSSGKITSAEAYDLYEGRVLFGYHYPRGEFDSLKFALQIAADVDRLAPNEFKMNDRILTVSNNLDYKNERQKLTEDIHPVVLPNKCKLEQTITFFAVNRIIADEEIWNALDSRSKASFYLHEAFFWKFRAEFGGKTARRTRRLVSYVVSSETFDSGVSNLYWKFETSLLLCKTGRKDVETNMFAYVEPTGRIAVRMTKLYGFPSGVRIVFVRPLPGGVFPVTGLFGMRSTVTLDSGETVEANLKLKQGEATLALGDKFPLQLKCGLVGEE